MGFGSVQRSLACAMALLGCSGTVPLTESSVKFAAPTPPNTPPHRDVSGAAAERVFRALASAIGREPESGETYDIPALGCTDLRPFRAGLSCSVTHRTREGDLTTILLREWPPSAERSEELIDAFRDAGVGPDLRSKAPGGAIRLSHVRATRDRLTFDDEGSSCLPIRPSLPLREQRSS